MITANISNLVLQVDLKTGNIEEAQQIIDKINEILQRELVDAQPQIMASELDKSDITFETSDITDEDIREWFYEHDAEWQNEFMNDADSDPSDERFYEYARTHYGNSIKKS